jgi:hypothetical protein
MRESGESTEQQSLSKLFKPLTEKIEKATEAIKEMPALPQQPVYHAIQAAPPLAPLAALAPPLVTDDSASEARAREAPLARSSKLTTELGEIATAYFNRFTSRNKDADTMYSIYDNSRKFCIGDAEIKIDGDDKIVGDKVYEGTPELWELIVSKTPSDEIYMIREKEKYIDILMSTNALEQNNDPNEVHPKSSRSPKWVNLLKPICSNYSRSSRPSRQHAGSSIILPSHPIALLYRLDLLLASHQACNTGV